MDVTNFRKGSLGITSSKQEFSYINLGMAETKVKKSKKKKKTKKSSEKRGRAPKVSSDEEKYQLEVEGIRALEKQVDDHILHKKLTKLPNIAVNQNCVIYNGSTDTLSKTEDILVADSSTPVANQAVHKQGVNSTKKKSKASNGKQVNGKSLQSNKEKPAAKLSKEKPELCDSLPTQSFSNLTLSPKSLESLRWDNVLEDADEEKERIRLYKLNRRKRYLAEAQAKGLAWATNYAMNSTFQLSEDAILEKLWPVQNSVTDFSPMRSLQSSHGRSMLSGLIEC